LTTILYFAYGSNMLTQRLQNRCPSAKPWATAQVSERAVKFFKRSDDGSGKATLIEERGSHVVGVVFDLDDRELPVLDKFEGAGKGYHRVDDLIILIPELQQPVIAVTYVADLTHVDEKLQPYDWYLRLVLAGARQHGLPHQYVEELKGVVPKLDLMPDRKERLDALKLLAQSEQNG
jgi:gamma-glutamylcyclotransferase